VLTDTTGPYANCSGAGSVLATEMAVEDFKRSHPGFAFPIEVSCGDFQLKLDLASALTHTWMSEGVDAIVGIPQSARHSP
jgi:branched-chain amino acid transport system substrate-binding protein